MLGVAAGAFYGERRGEGGDGDGLEFQVIQKVFELVIGDADGDCVWDAIYAAIAIAGEGGELAGIGVAGEVVDH